MPLTTKPYPIHRLDRLTTGALLLARNEQAARTLGQQLRYSNSPDRIRKTYLALVRGRFDPGEAGEIRQNLYIAEGRVTAIKDPLYRRNVPIAARETVTTWQCLSRGSGMNGPMSLLELGLHTGVKHQLRVICAAVLGAPIVGDVTHDPKIRDMRPVLKAQPRLMLHSARVEISRYLRQKVLGRRKYRLGVTVPPPRDFLRLCQELGISVDLGWTQQPIRVTIDGNEVVCDKVQLDEAVVLASLKKSSTGTSAELSTSPV